MRNITTQVRTGLLALVALAVVLAPAVGNAQLNVGLDPAKNIGLGTADLRDTIASIINVAMGLLGTIAVVIILYGGFKWMTSGGDQSKVDDARKLIINGVIGLVIILTSYAIAQFVITALLEGTGADTAV